MVTKIEGGLLEGLSAGKIWVDHSTTDFGQTFEFERAVKAKGAEILEAPISGGLGRTYDVRIYGGWLNPN